MATAKTVLRTMLAITATAAFAAGAPQATAAIRPTTSEPKTPAQVTEVAGVKISSKASAETREIAQSDPDAVRATASLCGSRYKLYNAERLPDERRFGTLFLYDNGGLSPDNWLCAVFDNNLGSSKWMKLSVCENKASRPRCDTDEGNYSQYAGPVKMNNCADTTALMKHRKGDDAYIINAVRSSFCN